MKGDYLEAAFDAVKKEYGSIEDDTKACPTGALRFHLKKKPVSQGTKDM